MKGTSRHTCTLATVAVLASSCIPDLPPDQVADAAPSPAEGSAPHDADADRDAGPERDAGAVMEAAVVRGCGDGYVDLEAGEQCDPGPSADSGVCSATCRMSCPSGFAWAGNNHCYLTSGTTTDFLPVAPSAPGALSACDAVSSHVVTFASEAEFEAVERGLELAKGDPPYWVGLENAAGRSYVSVVSGYEPGWDPTCPGCYAHTVNPNVALPKYVDADGGESSQSCVGASSDALDPTWRQRPCSGVKTRVICEREPVGVQFEPCEAGLCGDLVATYGAKRYVVVLPAATSDAAEKYCASLGGRLVILESHDEREQLWLQLSRLAPQVPRIWIGLSQSDAGPPGDAGDLPWVWDDGTAAASPGGHPSPWGDRMPVPNGVTSRAYLRAYVGEIDDTLARNDESSSIVQSMPFVCEITAPKGP